MDFLADGFRFLSDLVDVQQLNLLVGSMGPWFYVLLFAIIFCETGLVVTPFLPGDSLLFAVGAVAAIDGSPLSLAVLIVGMIVAAVVGDAVNYHIGQYLGPKVFARESSWLFNKKHLERAQRFYERYGGKTIILARFIPIIRTFAPFVAGIGSMNYSRFFVYNVAGAIAWVLSLTLAGYYFGRSPFVKDNFSLVILAIVILSILPAVMEVILARRRNRAALPETVAAPETIAAPSPPAEREDVVVRGAAD